MMKKKEGVLLRAASFAACLVCGTCVACFAAGAGVDDVLRKQRMIITEYEVLVRDLLVPAGKAEVFRRFTLRNPSFYRDSYARSRTAAVIRDLLKDKPRYLAVFEACGLSRPGSYVCTDRRCPLHGASFGRRRARPAPADADYIFYGLATAGGVLFFVLVTGGGRRVCALLERGRGSG